jgi:hypothetical protein
MPEIRIGPVFLAASRTLSKPFNRMKYSLVAAFRECSLKPLRVADYGKLQ